MSHSSGLALRMSSNKLRVDPSDGSPVMEYRIEDGTVERRTLQNPKERGTLEARWQRFTPEQLASHVRANSVVAYWLYRRLGIDWLLQAIGQYPQSTNDKGQKFAPSGRESAIAELSSL